MKWKPLDLSKFLHYTLWWPYRRGCWFCFLVQPPTVHKKLFSQNTSVVNNHCTGLQTRFFKPEDQLAILFWSWQFVFQSQWMLLFLVEGLHNIPRIQNARLCSTADTVKKFVGILATMLSSNLARQKKVMSIKNTITTGSLRVAKKILTTTNVQFVKHYTGQWWWMAWR